MRIEILRRALRESTRPAAICAHDCDVPVSTLDVLVRDLSAANWIGRLSTGQAELYVEKQSLNREAFGIRERQTRHQIR